jgi:ankyrin repeat protein
MVRPIATLVCLMSNLFLLASSEKRPLHPSYPYDVTRAHEIKPHRRTIPLEGVHPGFNQLRLTLIVSPKGDVIDADAQGNRDVLTFWPQLHGEVSQWKFMPFKKNGNAVTAEVEEYIDLVPPERPPNNRVVAPIIRPNSKVTITLRRTGCFGNCPSYSVAVSTDGIVFNGHGFVVAAGKHTDRADADADEVRKLAKKFAAADFYSMDAKYTAGVTDHPAYLLTISIDGNTKQVEDYVGSWEGMPAVITELEDEVDAFARTQRWIDGDQGLVQALQAEKFNFHTFEAQVMLKESASRGKTATVRDFLDAGVPLKPLPAPKSKELYRTAPFESVGWLNAASGHPDTLQILIDAGASEIDQSDKDLALAGAAGSGSITAVRALIAYGANPNADLSKLTVTENSMTMNENAAGSVLIQAARSGNPDVVREILRYRPDLEARDQEGTTAVFAAGEFSDQDQDGARVKCVRLLAQAGSDLNARDNDGNTPLHETFLTDVETELLKLGADVNARNADGETPIFTTVDDAAIPLFIEHGADLTLRNNDGQTVVEAAKEKGPSRQEALQKAIDRFAGPKKLNGQLAPR